MSEFQRLAFRTMLLHILSAICEINFFSWRTQINWLTFIEARDGLHIQLCKFVYVRS